MIFKRLAKLTHEPAEPAEVGVLVAKDTGTVWGELKAWLMLMAAAAPDELLVDSRDGAHSLLALAGHTEGHGTDGGSRGAEG